MVDTEMGKGRLFYRQQGFGMVILEDDEAFTLRYTLSVDHSYEGQSSYHVEVFATSTLTWNLVWSTNSYGWGKAPYGVYGRGDYQFPQPGKGEEAEEFLTPIYRELRRKARRVLGM